MAFIESGITIRGLIELDSKLYDLAKSSALVEGPKSSFLFSLSFLLILI
jgi:hypothetical protein